MSPVFQNVMCFRGAHRKQWPKIYVMYMQLQFKEWLGRYIYIYIYLYMHLNRQIQYYNSPYKNKTVTFSSDLLPVCMGLLIEHSWKHPFSVQHEGNKLQEYKRMRWDISHKENWKVHGKKNIFHMIKYNFIITCVIPTHRSSTWTNINNFKMVFRTGKT